jgi:hypothetical protein
VVQREYTSSSAPNNIGISNWSIDPRAPLDTLMPYKDNSYDCRVFVCLFSAFIAIQKPFTFSQADIDDVRMWRVHLTDEDGKKQNRDHTRQSSQSLQQHATNTHSPQLISQITPTTLQQTSALSRKRPCPMTPSGSDERHPSREKLSDFISPTAVHSHPPFLADTDTVAYFPERDSIPISE